MIQRDAQPEQNVIDVARLEDSTYLYSEVRTEKHVTVHEV